MKQAKPYSITPGLNIVCIVCALLAGAFLQSRAAAFDFTRLVAVGDSLLAGFRDGGLVEQYQRDGIAAVIARQAQTPFPQPLIAWPGIPNVLVLESMGPPPVIGRAPGESAGRTDPMQQVMNLATPAHTVSDMLRRRPDLPINSMADLVLGLPGLLGGVSRSQVEWAEALAPTTILVWAGNNDALNAAIAGSPDALTPAASFEADYTELLARLAAAGARLVVANIPDVAVIPYVQPAQNVAAMLGVPFALFSAALGVTADDHINLDGVGVAGAILMGAQAGPLPGNFVLTPSEIGAIRARTAEFNAVIAAQAAARGAVTVDTHGLLNGWKESGAPFLGRTLTTQMFGGIFSLDGIHPTSEGAGLTANAFIRAMNLAGATVPQTAWVGVFRDGERTLVRWTDSAVGYRLERSESIGAEWTSVRVIAAGETEAEVAAGFFRLRAQ